MREWKRRGCCLLLAVILIMDLSGGALAAVSGDTLEDVVADTAAYLYAAVPAPQVGSIGGEWTVLALARSGSAVPAGYYQSYYAAVEDTVRACGGVLSEKKYTEYSRVILALAAIGMDARNVAGYDLTRPLGDFGRTVAQGINGPIWALIALDSRDYPMPQASGVQIPATRQMYVDDILSRQLSGGGWSLSGTGEADPDITAMALQALAKYQDQPAVSKAIDTALDCMSALQSADGGFSSWGTDNAESTAQVIMALCELGIPVDDARFVKNGQTLLDHLMTFRVPGGGFRHTSDGTGSNLMATEQTLCCLAAVQRAAQGRSSLYRMGDAVTIDQNAAGPAGKDPAVTAQPIRFPGRTFDDISGENVHPNQAAIEALAARGIINGYDETSFGPDDTMTRAQFAAIVVRALGLPLEAVDNFTDVPRDAWYADYVGTACTYGIVNGISATTFAPESTITRQEAAVMVARAAALCGLDTAMAPGDIKEILTRFTDGDAAAVWAGSGLAFCVERGILDDSGPELQPMTAVRRCGIAQMLFNLLEQAELL